MVFVVMRMRESSLVSKIWRTIRREERTLKASEKAKTKTRKTATRHTGKRQRGAKKRLWIETQNKFIDILFA